MDGGILTISLGSWMELPDLTFKEWDSSKPRMPHGTPNCQNRVSVQRVAQYYHDYVNLKGLRPYFRNYAQVHSVTPLELDSGGAENGKGAESNHLWEVRGVDIETGMCFRFVTPHVVLAAGHYDAPRLLDVPGEDLPFVSHDLGQLEVLLRDTRSSISKLLVVGSGLSAADAVIAARFHGVDVCHVFRKKVDDRDLVFNQLPRSMYPEYHKVHRMMSASEHYPGYKAYGNSQIRCIHEDGRVELDSGLEILGVSHVLVLIGAHPNLEFLPCGGRQLGLLPGQPVDCRANPVQIDPYTHETLALKGVFALGPLVGDNFVRFLQGGALAVTARIWRSLAHTDST